MAMIRNATDGRCHLSDLKVLALSPSHYKHRVTSPFEPTRPMRIGTLTHRIVLGGKYHVNPDCEARRGKTWDAYYAQYGDDAYTASEMREALPAARALQDHPIAKRYLTGICERRIEWEDPLIGPCAGTPDIVGDNFIADIKTTHTAEPRAFQRTAIRLAYHAQLTWYADALTPVRDLYLLAVEVAPPHPVVVWRVTEKCRELAGRLLRTWKERLLACEAADEWPGYTQDILDLDVPEWGNAEDLLEE